MVKIGIIGGSGLYDVKELESSQDVDVNTKYGAPSSTLKTGTIYGVNVVFIARHGKEHTIPPTKVNFKANIQALKDIGCTHILATSACGSLKREIDRGHLVILDQFIDFTRHRDATFFDTFKPGEHGHTAMAEPFSSALRSLLISACTELQLSYHRKGTVITIEGPRFSTKAESKMFASWGADVINMSIAPEAALANEAKIPYAAIAMSTDYDCLFDDVPAVTHEDVLKVFSENVSKVIKLLLDVIPKVGKDTPSVESNEDLKNSNVKKNINDDEDDEDKLEEEEEEIDLKKSIRTIPNYPKEGIMFRDITTLIESPKAFNYCIQKFVKQYKNKGLTKIAGIESRGFIFGAPLAKELGLPFVLIRKKGKLPAEKISQEYELEYGTDKIEVHTSSINEDDNVLIIDDLIATGGTAKAACQLIEKLKGTVAGLAFVIDLPDLHGKSKLSGYDVFTMIEFDGD